MSKTDQNISTRREHKANSHPTKYMLWGVLRIDNYCYCTSSVITKGNSIDASSFKWLPVEEGRITLQYLINEGYQNSNELTVAPGKSFTTNRDGKKTFIPSF